MAEKTRYSDAELEEFRAIIMEKLELAQRDYDQLKMSLMTIQRVLSQMRDTVSLVLLSETA